MNFRFRFALVAAITLGSFAAHAQALIEVVGSQSATIGWDSAPGQVAGYDVFTSVNQQPETPQGRVGVDEPFVLNAAFGDTVVVRVRPFDATGEPGPISDASEKISFVASSRHDAPQKTAMDFNGDSHGDILIHNTGSREIEVWMMDGGIVESSAAMPEHLDDSWTVVATGDLNGDGMADLVWRRHSGDLILWLNDNGQVIDSVRYDGIGASWRILTSADFNGDGRDDLIFAGESGAFSVWLMDGLTIASHTLVSTENGALNIDTHWQLETTLDLNADGNADILWRHPTGLMFAWMMDGASVLDAVEIQAPSMHWSLAGTPDVDGDGTDELLWRHETGILYVWFMDGTLIGEHHRLPDPGVEWEIVGFRDFDGDGKEDVLWQHDVGLLYTFLMNGAFLHGHAMIGSPGYDFEVIGE